jgi:hypothetical protein
LSIILTGATAESDGFVYESRTENLSLFLRRACCMRDFPDMHMQAMVPVYVAVQKPRGVKKIFDLSL